MHSVVQHPLIEDKLAKLRDVRTGFRQFRDLARELSRMVGYEALRGLPLKATTIDTPLTTTQAREVATEIAIIPILRAGIGMVDGILDIAPDARVGFVGLYRDPKTKQAVEYYRNLPTPDAYYLVVDPMLATGGSMVATLDLLQKHGVTRMVVACLVAAPEGITKVEASYPDVHIHTAVIDSHLDKRKYIVPGLGDAGDRLFGTHL